MNTMLTLKPLFPWLIISVFMAFSTGLSAEKSCDINAVLNRMKEHEITVCDNWPFKDSKSTRAACVHCLNRIRVHCGLAGTSFPPGTTAKLVKDHCPPE